MGVSGNPNLSQLRGFLPMALTAQQVAEQKKQVEELIAGSHIDHMQIDRDAMIPDSVVKGLGDIGLYKATIPTEFGGLGFGQQQYLKTMEVIGGHDASVAVFVNAHHSIGVRSLVLFGTKEQQAKWLPG